jgi:hypothetical protein
MIHISISIAMEVALNSASCYVKLGEISDCVLTGQLHPGNRLVFLQIIWVERRYSSYTALLTTACQAGFIFFFFSFLVHFTMLSFSQTHSLYSVCIRIVDACNTSGIQPDDGYFGVAETC